MVLLGEDHGLFVVHSRVGTWWWWWQLMSVCPMDKQSWGGQSHGDVWGWRVPAWGNEKDGLGRWHEGLWGLQSP